MNCKPTAVIVYVFCDAVLHLVRHICPVLNDQFMLTVHSVITATTAGSYLLQHILFLHQTLATFSNFCHLFANEDAIKDHTTRA